METCRPVAKLGWGQTPRTSFLQDFNANFTTHPQKPVRSWSPQLKTHPFSVLPLVFRVVFFQLKCICDLHFQCPLRHLSFRRIRIHAPRMNGIHANIQNIPAPETA